MDRKKQILIILMVVWTLLIVYRLGSQEEPKRVPLKYVKGQIISKNEVLSRSQSGFTVRLDLLEDRLKIALNNPRNVFAPLQIYLPAPPAPPQPAEPPPPPPPPTPEELAIQQARRDLGQFRYLGYLNKGQGRDQAFLARDRELFIVGKGQTISGTIYLKDLTSSYVILQEKNTHVEVTLNISGG